MVVAMAGIPLASILGWYWLRLHQTRSENALKKAMVERGMSAADIERVMAAGEGGSKAGGDVESRARGREPVAGSR